MKKWEIRPPLHRLNVKISIYADIFHCKICYYTHTEIPLLPSTALLQTVCFAARNNVICVTIKANGMSVTVSRISHLCFGQVASSTCVYNAYMCPPTPLYQGRGPSLGRQHSALLDPPFGTTSGVRVQLIALWPSNSIFTVPKTRTKFGKTAFSIAGPSLWNYLWSSSSTDCTMTVKFQIQSYFLNILITCSSSLSLIFIIFCWLYSCQVWCQRVCDSEKNCQCCHSPTLMTVATVQ